MKKIIKMKRRPRLDERVKDIRTHAHLAQINEHYRWNMVFEEPLESSYQFRSLRSFQVNLNVSILTGCLIILWSGIFDTIRLMPTEADSLYSVWGVYLLALIVGAVVWGALAVVQGHRARQVILAITAVLWSAIVCILAVRHEEPFKYIFYFAVFYVQVAVFVLLRLRLPFAMVSGAVTVLLMNMCLLWFEHMPFLVIVGLNSLIISGTMFALLVCYVAERSSRLTFLQSEILSIEKARLRKINLKLRDELLKDSLTGVANRRGFDDALAEEWSRSKRNGYPVSLILFDIDCFKQFNDLYGHQAGDECLKAVAQVPARMVQRPGDLVARYGGEEFAIILSGTELVDAIAFAEKVRKEIEALGIPAEKSSVSNVVTISAGASCITPQGFQETHDLITMADKMLYEAKGKGRNAVAGRGRAGYVLT